MIKNTTYLIFGLSITGFTVGYMVGGSATPVVGVAIPLLFGLIITTFGLFQPNKIIKNLSKSNEDNTELVNEIIIQSEIKESNTKKNIGLALIFFSSFYLLGTFVGASARVNKWFVFNQEQNLLWTEKNEPKTLLVALKWITIHQRLNELGYSEKDIKSLYELHKLELELEKTIKQTDKSSHKKGSLLGDSQEFKLNQILEGLTKKPSDSLNPFTKEFENYLRREELNH